MRILVTGGPTREHWDRVRFLTSAASGRMGIEIGRAAIQAGHEAVLVIGPTELDIPEDPGLAVHRVVSARDMLAACQAAWPECDAFIASAAVADYRPAAPHADKMHKTPGPVSLEMVRNPDIVATLASTKGSRPVVGFALEVQDAEDRALRKLARKHLDAIVLDGPAELGTDSGTFRLLLPDGSGRDFTAVSKADLARALIDLVTGGA